MPDPLGNVNNWLFVRRLDTQSAGCVTALHNDGCRIPVLSCSCTCSTTAGIFVTFGR